MISQKQRLDRRRFLQMAAGGLAGHLIRPPSVPAETDDADVLIIGAGIAGIAAANQLGSTGISSIVLEARDRLGGRIWSSLAWPDATIDMGASFIHDSRDSPLTPLAERYDIKTTYADFANFSIQEPGNTTLGVGEVASLVLEYGTIISDVLAGRAEREAAGLPDEPLSNLFESAVRAQHLSSFDLRGIQTLIDANLRVRYGTTLCDLSLFHFDQDENVVGEHDLVFPAGYVQIANALAARQDVRYRHVVNKIEYTADGVTVSTNNGQFTGGYAIVTLPLGVLQNGTIEFKPELPGWKASAIDGLATGDFDKIVLRFPSAFWNNQRTFLLTTPKEVGRFDIWFNMMPVVGVPVLMAFVGGDFARAVQGIRDAELVAMAMQTLRQLYGTEIPQPTGFQRSRWSLDPFSRGCYSHIPPGASPADYNTMSLPVPYAGGSGAWAYRLFFAGEATHQAHPASVWGAYESGLREASRILEVVAMGTLPGLSQPSQSRVQRTRSSSANTPKVTNADQSHGAVSKTSSQADHRGTEDHVGSHSSTSHGSKLEGDPRSPAPKTRAGSGSNTRRSANPTAPAQVPRHPTRVTPAKSKPGGRGEPAEPKANKSKR